MQVARKIVSKMSLLTVLVCIIGLAFILRRERRISSEEWSSQPIYTNNDATFNFGSFSGGNLTKEGLRVLVDKLSSNTYKKDYEWFVDITKFSPYISERDGLALQMYHIPQPDAESVKISLVFSTGFSETFVKYSPVLRRLHNIGAEIHGFDMRGQGFSSSTGWSEGRITHITEFEDYSQDLQNFVEQVVRPSARRKGSNAAPLYYMGNSLGGLIGYTAQMTHRDGRADQKLFDKLVLSVPCFGMAPVQDKEKLLLRFLYNIIPTSLTALFPLVRISHDKERDDLTNNMELFSMWVELKKMASRQLVIAGPSMRWLFGVQAACDTALSAKTPVIDATDMLIISASGESRVIPEKVDEFYAFVADGEAHDEHFLPHSLGVREENQGGHLPSSVIEKKDNEVYTKVSHCLHREKSAVRRHVHYNNTYHEIWTEHDHVVDSLMLEVQSFWGLLPGYSSASECGKPRTLEKGDKTAFLNKEKVEATTTRINVMEEADTIRETHSGDL